VEVECRLEALREQEARLGVLGVVRDRAPAQLLGDRERARRLEPPLDALAREQERLLERAARQRGPDAARAQLEVVGDGLREAEPDGRAALDRERRRADVRELLAPALRVDLHELDRLARARGIGREAVAVGVDDAAEPRLARTALDPVVALLPA